MYSKKYFKRPTYLIEFFLHRPHRQFTLLCTSRKGQAMPYSWKLGKLESLMSLGDR